MVALILITVLLVTFGDQLRTFNWTRKSHGLYHKPHRSEGWKLMVTWPLVNVDILVEVSWPTWISVVPPILEVNNNGWQETPILAVDGTVETGTWCFLDAQTLQRHSVLLMEANLTQTLLHHQSLLKSHISVRITVGGLWIFQELSTTRSVPQTTSKILNKLIFQKFLSPTKNIRLKISMPSLTKASTLSFNQETITWLILLSPDRQAKSYSVSVLPLSYHPQDSHVLKSEMLMVSELLVSSSMQDHKNHLLFWNGEAQMEDSKDLLKIQVLLAMSLPE